MPLSRQEKQDLVSSYASSFATASHAFVLSFRGISVPQVTDLRQRIRAGGGQYQVVKNRLALLAVKGTPLEGLAPHFDGPTAVAYSEQDPVALAKVLADFAKEVPAVEFKAGLVDGQQVPGEEIQAIASLPSREDLIAKLLYLLLSPISRLVTGLAQIPQQLVVVLDQIRLQKEAQE